MKNLPVGTTEEELIQGLNSVQVHPTGATITHNLEPQEVNSDVFFPDYEACNASADVIEKSRKLIKINGQDLSSVEIAGVETPGAELFPSDLSSGTTTAATPGQGTPQAPQQTPKQPVAQQTPQQPVLAQSTPTPEALTRYQDGKGATPS